VTMVASTDSPVTVRQLRARPRKRNADEAEIVGRALLAARRASGMTLRQLAAESGVTLTSICRYEHGELQPRARNLRRIVEALGLTMTDLYRAQRQAEEQGEDGTLPPDTRTPPADTLAGSHKAAIRLAQECGKAVAHCCLAFIELQAGGWDRTPLTGGEPRGSRHSTAE
jgi:transcriptional regulator with XRE-family HTH domain